MSGQRKGDYGYLMAETLPQHIAIIMDGNGRWAKERGLLRTDGHKAGADAVRKIVTECRKLGIAHLTLYTFSHENWNRPKEEVSTLFALLVEFLGKEVPLMVQEEISLHIFGDISELPFAARKALEHGIAKTAPKVGQKSKMCLNLALNYGGRNEILRAAKQLVLDGIAAEDITEESFRQRLYTQQTPDPDLVIRTSGEIRISNYLLFQCAYSEFYFCSTLWPDFGPTQLHAALDSYAARNRRFGKIQEQIS